MHTISNFKDLRLSSFTSQENIEERAIEYSLLKGIAEIVGKQVIFFRDEENPKETSILYFHFDFKQPEHLDLINHILMVLNLYLQLGDSLEKIISLYGNPFSKEENQGSIQTYNYLFNHKQCYMSLGVDPQKGLSSIEIIAHKKMIQRILNINEGEILPCR